MTAYWEIATHSAYNMFSKHRYLGIEDLPVPAKKDRQNSLSKKRSFLSLFVFIIV